MKSLVFFALTALGAAVTPAVAQDSRPDVTLAYQFQHLSGSGESLNLPVGFNIDVSAPLYDGLRIVGQSDWSRKTDSATVQGASVAAAADFVGFGGGVRWEPQTVDTMKPFVEALFGALRSSSSASVAGTSVGSESSTDPMVQFGGGLAAGMGGRIKAVGEVDYRRIFGDGAGVNGVRLLAGVRIPF